MYVLKKVCKRYLALLLALAVVCSALVMPASAKDYYTISVSDDTVGTAVVEAGKTVTMNVTITGAPFNGLQAAVVYDNSLFQLKSANGIAVDDNKQTDGVIELYMLNHAALASGTTVATLVFTAIDTGATATGSFGFAYATVGDYEAFRQNDAVTAMTNRDNVTIEETFAVSGKVQDADKNPLANVLVVLKKGNKTIAEAKSVTDEKGEFTLTEVHSGTYNLIATEQNGGRTMTILVEVQADQYIGTIEMPAANISSELEVTEDTPAVVVGGLDQVAEEYEDEAEETVHIAVSMTIAATEDLTESMLDSPIKAAQEEIKKEATDGSDTKTEFAFFEVDLTKTTTTTTANSQTEETQEVKETNNLLKIIIPFDTTGKSNFKVYRYHEGNVDVLTTTKNSNGEYIDVEDDQITVYAKFFSTYAISFSEGNVYAVTKIPNAVYWGFDSVAHGEDYRFGVYEGYDKTYATPTVTMGGSNVTVTKTSSGYMAKNVTGELVIESPKHSITFHSDEPNIVLPAGKTAHYGENCQFILPKPITCVVASMKVGNAQAQTLTADPSGEVTIPGKNITDNIVVTLAYQHTFTDADYTYKWSDDYATCTATRVCKHCKATESETATSRYVINADGTKTFIAEFENPAFETQTIKTNFGKVAYVTFRLIGDFRHDNGVKDHDEYVTWIETTEYQIKLGDTVYDVFTKALLDHGLSQRGAADGYVRSVKAPSILGGYWLSEFDNGPNAGWLYSVNGDSEHGLGMKEYILETGDEIIWYYSDDYVEEAKPSSRYYQRWLEADDISPETYVKRHLDKIVTIEGKGEVEPKLNMSHIGNDVKFTFTPAEGWVIKAVYVDGKDKGAIETYTYKDLSMASRIEVVFTQNVPYQMSFVDVPEYEWFYDDVYFVASNGLFNGTSETTFSPHAPMTRAMLVTVLYRLEGEPAVAGGSAFTDVKRDWWYTDAVNWAAKYGIIQGYSETEFRPDEHILREQMAAILYRYAAYKEYDVSKANKLTHYSDYSELSLYALDAMKWANAEGLINGRTLTTLVPKGTATRAEVAAILHRFVENVVK